MAVSYDESSGQMYNFSENIQMIANINHYAF